MNKNSIKICKVFVTSLNSELRQCFPPLWLRHSSFAAGAGEIRAGIKRCPPQIYLVITIPHFKKASDCFHVHFVEVLGCNFYHFNLRNVCHRKVFFSSTKLKQSSSTDHKLLSSQKKQDEVVSVDNDHFNISHPRSVRVGNCMKRYMPTTDR